MTKFYNINIFDFLTCLSDITDWISPELNNHHTQVGIISVMLARALHLSEEDINSIASAAILHDIGSISLIERLKLIRLEEQHPEVHAELGYKLLKMFKPLEKSALAVRYHHTPYNTNLAIPLSAAIINIADRISVLIDNKKEILGQVEYIKRNIVESSKIEFYPEVVNVFYNESQKPSFWFDAVSYNAHKQIKRFTTFNTHKMDSKELLSLAKFISRLIDFRSRFTATHSSGVSAVAEYIGKISGMNEQECFELKIAGMLHDLGKLAVPNEILEKPGKLTIEEFNVMKCHTYYTYRALEPFDDLSEINKAASFHHENLDGKGYPFNISANDISKSSRIMAVADVFTALTEDRPYRVGMDNPMSILQNMTGSKLDASIVKLVQDKFEEVNRVRRKAQTAALLEYKNF